VISRYTDSKYWYSSINLIKKVIRNSMTWVALGSFFLRIMSAPSVIPVSPHDDLLQVRLALKISKGDWLGSYGDLGHLTMVKPPGYPIFLAFSTMLGISPQILVHLVLLIVTAMLVRQIIPATLHNARVIVYALGVLWPTLFGAEFSRYYREGLIYVLSLVALLLMMSICRTLINKFNKKVLALKLSALGLSLGLVLITKPIALAYVPALSVIFIAILVKQQKNNNSVIKRFLLSGGLISLTAIFALTPPALVAAQNQKTYGVYQVDSYSGGSFKRAITAITGLPPHTRSQSEMVSNGQLETLSTVGPYSYEIVKKFRSGNLDNWTAISCGNGGACNSSGGWFMFALRDAIAMTGEDTTAIQFNDSLDKISTEIKSFCHKNGDCYGGDLAIGVKIPSGWDWFEFLNSYVTVANEMIFPFVGTSQYLSKDQIAPEIYQEWLQMPGIPLRDSRSNYTNPVPGFLKALTPLMLWGFTTLFFINAQRKKSIRRSRQPTNRDVRSFYIAKATDDLSIFGMIIGLGSFLCLASQLAALQASSGIYLESGADVYSITCLAPFFVFVVSFVSYMLKDRFEENEQATEKLFTNAS
jgi:hypothetical protein